VCVCVCVCGVCVYIEIWAFVVCSNTPRARAAELFAFLCLFVGSRARKQSCVNLLE